ncbi:Conidiation-specific protein 6 [Lentinula edodes]|uniref:Conidiation-specific protein 6 n=1 Tax=Lentinula edodes TaxID=5353 RepID=A0A1Q3EF11_LENED|nr:Conidiation-specific protein 6 [Lentinula edodes]
MSGNDSQKNPERVAAGLRGTLHNDNASDEAKDRATERLREMGDDFENKTSRGSAGTGDAHQNQVLGGYKATLHNDNRGAFASVQELNGLNTYVVYNCM